MGKTRVGRVREHPLLLTLEPFRFSPKSFANRKRLDPESDFMIVMRERSVDWVAQNRDRPRVGHQCGKTFGNQRME